MRIRVQFSSLVANITGKSEEDVNVPEGATFRVLLNTLAMNYGKDFRDLLLTERGQLRRLAHIVVNGQDVIQLGGLDISLEGIPQVSIIISIPAITGG